MAKEIECLYSVINIGDNLNDEWFIAKIALELSKNFPVTISVWDNHGQFMAIEAIDHFPVQDDYDEIENDLESDIENRIFLYKGEIRFIPLNIKVPNKLNKAIKVFWKVVSEDNQQTFLPEIFNKTVMKKINFNFKADRHSFNVKLSSKLAHVINVESSLVGKAIKRYCARDASDNDVIRKMKFFNPTEDTFVYKRIILNRFLFAQLVCAKKFYCEQFDVEDINESENDEENPSSLGLKIQCGFELLVYDSELSTDYTKGVYVEEDKANKLINKHTSEWNDYQLHFNKVAEIFPLDKLANDQRIIKTTFTLKLMVSNDKFARKNGERSAGARGRIIKRILETNNTENFVTDISELPEDDDTKWMDVDATDLDYFFMEDVDFGDEDLPTTGLESLANRMTDFMETQSDFKGVEIKGQNLFFSEENYNFESETDNEDRDSMSVDTSKIFKVIKEDKNKTNKKDKEEKDEKMLNLMAQMDEQISKTKVGQSFEKISQDGSDVDIDINLVKNIVNSVEGQKGGPGPATNLMLNLKD